MADKKRLLWLFARVLVYLCIIGVVLAWILSNLLITAAKNEPRRGPEKFHIPFENVIINTKDGQALHGWWIQGKGSGGVILCHGIGDDKTGVLNQAPYLYAAGYAVLLFDFRGHGENAGNTTSMGCVETAELDAAVDFMIAKGIFHVGVIGQSMGACIAIRTTEENPRIQAVVSDCSYARLDETIARYAKRLYHLPSWPAVPLVVGIAELRTGYDFYAVNPVESVKNIHVPILIIHGLSDGNIPYNDSERIYAAANEPKELMLVEGAGHVESYSTDQSKYEKKVKEFFGKYLRGQ